jgi:hypothetical protein
MELINEIHTNNETITIAVVPDKLKCRKSTISN